MAGRDPLEGGVALEVFLVEDDGFVFAAQFAEAGFEAFADGPERSGNFAEAIDMTVLAGLAGIDARNRCGLGEEVLDDLGDQPAFLGLGRFPDDGGQVQLAPGETFQSRVGDGFKALRVHFLDDAALDDFLGHLIARIHLADHALQLIRGEDVAEDVEHLAGAPRIEVVFDGLDALEELVEHAALAGVGRDEIEDEAVHLLAVTMDAAHALLQPHGIPRDVVIDHQPAELQVDAFAGGFGGDEHLGGLAKLAFGEDAGAGRVAVADLHAAVNLRHGQAPFAELAQRTAVLAVAAEEIQRVLVLGEDEQLHLWVVEDAVLLDDFAEPDELGFDFAFFEGLGELDELAEFDDFLAQGGGIVGGDEVFQFGDDFLLLLFRQIIEVVGQAPVDLRLPIGLRVGEDVFTLVPHALEAAAHGVNAGGKAALQHRHREAEGTAARGILGGGLEGLVFDEPGQGIIKVEFVEIDLEVGGADDPPGEKLFGLAGFRVGKGDERLLDAPEIERGFLLAHGLLQALHVAVNVAVKQFEEEAEVFRVALVRSGGHQQVMIRHLGEFHPEVVGERGLVAAGGAHFVRLVHNDEIPVAAEEAFPGIGDARHPRNGGDDLVLVLPRIGAVVGAEHVAADDLEVLTKLVLHFALPLEAEVGGSDDQGARDEAADLQFLEQQAGHDGFAGTGVVGQQEPDARLRHEVMINGLKLVRQRVHTRDGQRKIRIVLECQRQAHGLDGEPEALRIAIEGFGVGSGFEDGEIVRREDGFIHARRVDALGNQLHGIAHRNGDDDLHRLRKYRAAQNLAGLELIQRHEGGAR